jgi:hypothetical protein
MLSLLARVGVIITACPLESLVFKASCQPWFSVLDAKDTRARTQLTCKAQWILLSDTASVLHSHQSTVINGSHGAQFMSAHHIQRAEEGGHLHQPRKMFFGPQNPDTRKQTCQEACLPTRLPHTQAAPQLSTLQSIIQSAMCNGF